MNHITVHHKFYKNFHRCPTSLTNVSPSFKKIPLNRGGDKKFWNDNFIFGYFSGVEKGEGYQNWRTCLSNDSKQYPSINFEICFGGDLTILNRLYPLCSSYSFLKSFKLNNYVISSKNIEFLLESILFPFTCVFVFFGKNHIRVCRFQLFSV